jgi:hypothetical protein
VANIKMGAASVTEPSGSVSVSAPKDFIPKSEKEKGTFGGIQGTFGRIQESEKEKEQIAARNRDQISQMSAGDVSEAQGELTQRLSAKTLAFLRKRGQQQAAVDASSQVDLL